MNRNEKASVKTGFVAKSAKAAALLALAASVLTGCATTGGMDANPAQTSFEDVHHGA
jgi:hypothetical protein